MGFDDMLCDEDVLEQLKKTLQCAVGFYEDWDNIEKMEKEHSYQGYSFIYKIFYEYHWVMFQGMNPRSIKDDEWTMRALPLYTRRDTLKMYVEKEENSGRLDYSELAEFKKIIELAMQCEKDIKAIRHDHD